MILTNCAACAAPLAHNAPRCVRCKLRYCNATCQHDHWRRGHKHADTLVRLRRFEEVRSLLRKTMPSMRRVLGESHEVTLKARTHHAVALHKDDGATIDDLHEAVNTLEETARTGRRVFGGAHPTTQWIERHLSEARAALRARETPPPRRP
jgi:hypothetical protein